MKKVSKTTIKKYQSGGTANAKKVAANKKKVEEICTDVWGESFFQKPIENIIQKGFETLIDNGGNVGVTDIFRAIDRKGKILGASYKGQTVWALLDNQQAMLRLFELIHECVPGKYVDVLIERAVQEGLCTPADVIYDDIEDDIDNVIDLPLQ